MRATAAQLSRGPSAGNVWSLADVNTDATMQRPPLHQLQQQSRGPPSTMIVVASCHTRTVPSHTLGGPILALGSWPPARRRHFPPKFSVHSAGSLGYGCRSYDLSRHRRIGTTFLVPNHALPLPAHGPWICLFQFASIVFGRRKQSCVVNFLPIATFPPFNIYKTS